MTPTDGWIGHIIFIAALLGTIALVTVRTRRLIGFLRLGAPDNRTDDPWGRIKTVLINVFGQRRLLNNRVAGTVHLLIFYGFIIITLGTIQLILGGLNRNLGLPLVGGDPVYQFVLDVLCVLVLAACGVALYRRLVTRTPRLDNTGDAFIILGLIALLMVSLLLAEAFAIRTGARSTANASPIGGGLALLFGSVHGNTATLLYGACWWLHILTVFGFAIYLPASKHLHIAAAAPNTYFRQSGPRGALSPIHNIEEAESFGVGKLEQFSWKHLLDLYSCTECGRCDRNCPALLSDKPLSPKELIQNLKHELFEIGDDLVAAKKAGQNGDALPERTPLIGGVIADETLWACTTCRWCVEACPVMIEHVPKIIEMRRNLVLEESRFPQEVVPVFNNLEKNGNPWQISRNTRGDWAKDLGVLGVRTMAEVARNGERIDVLYFVGCMGSFDQRNKKVAVAVSKSLQAAGVSFAILGKEEVCNGDPARRIGNEYLFQMLAQENVETLNTYGVKKVLTACAHCFNTIKNEYPQFGGNYEVVHHTQFLTELVESGRLKLSGDAATILGQNAANSNVTYHDPCYMGRYNDVYEQPRRGLKNLPIIAGGIGNLVEMERNRRQSFCCGGGGGRSFMEESQGKRISGVRLDQAMETGAGTVAAGCPFCITMFEDGIKTKGVEGQMQVKDVSELIAAAIVDRTTA